MPKRNSKGDMLRRIAFFLYLCTDSYGCCAGTLFEVCRSPADNKKEK